MFGYVAANPEELTQEQRERYLSLYCGLCRSLGRRASQASRLALNYDLTFLALVLSSLYEPEEASGRGRCLPHPARSRLWVSSPVVDYAADVHVVLAYYAALDHWKDDHRLTALAMERLLKRHCGPVFRRLPRQCDAVTEQLARLSQLEQSGCENPDEPAGCFGAMMAELFDYRQDVWSPYLRQMATALGRFIYLLDATLDYEADRKRGSYNPIAASGGDPAHWEDYLVQEMAACCSSYEMLPLVQDKQIMDNILYSGVWRKYRAQRKTREETA